MRRDGAGPYVLGIDGGTEGIRAGLFTLTGSPVAFGVADYPSCYPRPGWAEQDPDDWWRGCGDAVHRALAAADVPSGAVAGVGFCCTSSTVVLTDAAGRPLRPALLWMDVRSSEEAQLAVATGDPALKYSGYTHASAEWLPCKACWVAGHEPATYGEAVHVVEYTDWLGYRLTGEWAASLNTATIRSYYDRDSGGWATSLYEKMRIPDLVDKLPSRTVPMGRVLGKLRREAADYLGLQEGIPVAEGGADAFVAMFGIDALTPGSLALVTGSSHLHLAQTSTPTYAPGLFGAYTDAVLPGSYTVEGGQISTGSVISWFLRTCGRQQVGVGAARGVGHDESDAEAALLFEELSNEAARIRPGSEGVLALEYWQGNRTPYVDAEARGMVWGLTLHHRVAHVYRALLEAVCYGTDVILDAIRSRGQDISRIVACGGALRNALWMQIHADVSGLPITVTEVPEAAALGAAVLGATAAGFHPSLEAASATMVRSSGTVLPDPDAHDAYRFYVERYIAAYPAMRSLMHEVARHEAVASSVGQLDPVDF